MTLDEIHNEVIEIQREIMDLAPGSSDLPPLEARIRNLQGELERTRSTLGPLVPDAASPKSPQEKSADDLAAALESLMTAAGAKQVSASP